MSNSATTCLHCGLSRAAVKQHQLGCGLVDAFGEMLEDYGNHRWADWHNADLQAYGILPQFYDDYRRTQLPDFRFIACRNLGKEHVLVEDDDILPYGICIRCWEDTRDTTTDLPIMPDTVEALPVPQTTPGDPA